MASELATANSATSDVASAQVRTVQDDFRGRFFYVLRRWPLLPIAIVILLVGMTVLAPWVAPFGEEEINLRGRGAPPFWYTEWYAENPRLETRYILGADHLGRDVLTRIMYGGRVSLTVAAISLVIGISIGSALGLVSGYFGGLFDEIMMRLVDVWNALPFLLIAILAAITVGQSVPLLLALLSLASWAGSVRNVRAETLTLKTREYVSASKVAGGSNIRIMIKHITPNVINTIVVLATLRVGGLILTEASLSYLGAGVPSNIPTWGNMVSDGQGYLNSGEWWISVFPGTAILLVVMSVNFIGDWLRDRFDPRLRQL